MKVKEARDVCVCVLGGGVRGDVCVLEREFKDFLSLDLTSYHSKRRFQRLDQVFSFSFMNDNIMIQTMHSEPSQVIWIPLPCCFPPMWSCDPSHIWTGSSTSLRYFLVTVPQCVAVA